MSGLVRTVRIGAVVEAALAWLAGFVVVCVVVGTAYLFVVGDPGGRDDPGGRACASCVRHLDGHEHGSHGKPAT